MSGILRLPMKREHFDAVKAGTKVEEYRLRSSAHWRQRLEGREYDAIELTLGYPGRGDAHRILRRPWRGYTVKTITHPLFGDAPVEVYAIDVAAPGVTACDEPNSPAVEKAITRFHRKRAEYEYLSWFPISAPGVLVVDHQTEAPADADDPGIGHV